MNSNIVHASLQRRAVPNISSCYHGSIWLLILCGDGELNPGPARQADIFPCGHCAIAVSWSEQGVCCYNHSLWFHRTYHSMSLTEYEEIGDRSRKVTGPVLTYQTRSIHTSWFPKPNPQGIPTLTMRERHQYHLHPPLSHSIHRATAAPWLQMEHP